MNWTRGFFRIWLLGTFLWIAITGAILRPDEIIIRHLETWDLGISLSQINQRSSLGYGPQPTTHGAKASPISVYYDDGLASPESTNTGPSDRDMLMVFAMICLIPPWAAFLIGMSLIWVFLGFRPRP